MTSHDYFQEMEFQIWSITIAGELKIGSGGVGGAMALQGTGTTVSGGGIAMETGTSDPNVATS